MPKHKFHQKMENLPSRQKTFYLRADAIDKNGIVELPNDHGFTKMVVEVDEETAQRIMRLILHGNPVTEIEGLEKLCAVHIIDWVFNRGDFLPRWIEALPVVIVEVRQSSAKELPAWLFSIPTIKNIMAREVFQMETVDLGPKPSTTLKVLVISTSNFKSLPDNLFAHALKTVYVENNIGKE